jgi:hypothetical protein
VAGLYEKIAAREHSTLASLHEEGLDEGLATAADIGLVNPDLLKQRLPESTPGVVMSGGLAVEEKFVRVQVDDDEYVDDNYRGELQREVDERVGKVRRRVGYSGIHGQDGRIEHTDGFDDVGEDEAVVLGNFDLEQEKEEAIMTQFDDDEDAAAEVAVMQEEEGTGVENELGAEDLAVAEGVGGAASEDEEDDDLDSEEEAAVAKAKRAAAKKKSIFDNAPGSSISVAERRRIQAVHAQNAAIERKKRPREEVEASIAEDDASKPKRVKEDKAARLERSVLSMFVKHGGRLTVRTIEAMFQKAQSKFGEFGKTQFPIVVGRMAVRRGETGADAQWELRSEQWRHVQSNK